MAECSYTSLQVQGYVILLIKTPRGEGLKREIIITLPSEKTVIFIAVLGFNVLHACEDTERLHTTGLQWSWSQLHYCHVKEDLA